MKRLLFPLLALLQLLSSAKAHIGDTPEQCDARYGSPIRKSQIKEGMEEVRSYLTAGLSIIVRFYQGHCDFVSYQKIEKNSLGDPLPLSDHEIDLLLQSNTRGLPWNKIQDYPTSVQWDSSDSNLHANYDPMEHHSLNLGTVEFMKRESDRKKAEESKNLQGL